jgi:hypothetical protein
MSDELIASMVAVEGSNNNAVIAGLKYIISQLSRPNFTADWLAVDSDAARKGYQTLLDEKRREFGIASITASTVRAWRADSDAVEEPDYDL